MSGLGGRGGGDSVTSLSRSRVKASGSREVELLPEHRLQQGRGADGAEEWAVRVGDWGDREAQPQLLEIRTSPLRVIVQEASHIGDLLGHQGSTVSF